MIRIDATAVVGNLKEVHKVNGSPTLLELLKGHGYDPGSPRAEMVRVYVNNEQVSKTNLTSRVVTNQDDILVAIEPNGPVAIGIAIGALIGLVSSFLFKPTVTGVANQRQGKKIEVAAIDANQPRLGQVVPDIAGECVVWPDIIVPPRTYFVQVNDADGERSVQWYEVGLCVAWGYYEKPPAQVKVGDTPFISFGEYAETQFFEPGESVANSSPFQWWHTNKEVGATRTGSSGLELTTTQEIQGAVYPSSFQLRGNTVILPDPADFFPDSWEPGMLIRIRNDFRIQFTTQTDPNTGARLRNRLYGNLEDFNPGVGMRLQIIGQNAGEYIVHEFVAATASTSAYMTLSFTDGTPASFLETGTSTVGLGVPGMVYSIVANNYDSLVVGQPRSGTSTPWFGFLSQDITGRHIPLDISTREGSWVGPVVACPENSRSTAIEVDFHFPNGLIGYNGSGDKQTIYVAVEIQLRNAMTNDGWESHVVEFSKQSEDAFGYTHRINFTQPRNPEVRTRILNKDDRGHQTVRDTVNWYQLKARMETQPTAYQDVTTLAVRLAGDKRTSASTDNQINCRVRRRIPNLVDNQIGTELVSTRSGVDYAIYALQSVGFEPRFLGLEDWQALRTKLVSRGDTYDRVHRESFTVGELISDVLNTGFADKTYRNGLLIPVRDEKRSGLPEFGFSSQNMRSEMEINITPPNPDDPDGVDVTYRDFATWAERTVRCRLPGDQGQRVKKVVAHGITDRDRAYRFGMRNYLEEKLRRIVYTVTTGLEARNIAWMSHIGLANDVPGYTQSGKMISYEYLTNNRIRVYTNQVFEWVEGSTCVVAFRRPDGTLTEAYTATPVQEEITAFESQRPDFPPVVLDATGRDPTDIFFGPVGRFLYRALVDTVTAEGSYNDEEEPTMTIEAVNYTDALYEYDDSSAPENA